jgi:hypothetical protein
MRNLRKIAVMAVMVLVSVVANAQSQGSFIVSGNEGQVTIHNQMREEEIISHLQKGVEVRVLKSFSEQEWVKTYIVDKYFVDNDGSFKVIEEKITLTTKVVEPTSWEDEAEKTQVVEKLYNNRKRDTYLAKLNGVEAGTKTLKAANKYGWGVNIYGGYEYYKSMNAPVFGAGVEFTQPMWMISLSGEGGWSEYTENAVNSGKKYMNYRTSLLGGFQPFKFDSFDQNRLFLVGGLKFKWYQTDSPEVEGETFINSWGSYLTPVFGVKYEHRMFATGNAWWLELTTEQNRGIILNSGDDTEWGVSLKVGFNFGIGRKKINNQK